MFRRYKRPPNPGLFRNHGVDSKQAIIRVLAISGFLLDGHSARDKAEALFGIKLV